MSVAKPNIQVLGPITSNYTAGRSKPISRITFHHIVGDAPAAIATFKAGNRGDSSNFIIGSDGAIYGVIPENDTAWCDANWDSNCRTISIEHAGGIASVPYTDAMYEASKRLVAYLIDKYGISDFKRHRDVSTIPTACPGDLNMEAIVDGAHAIISEANRPAPPLSPPPAAPGLTIEDIPDKQVRISHAGGADLWDLGFTDWASAKAMKHFDEGAIIQDVSAIAHHPLGGSYYLTEYSYARGIHSGINIADCQDIPIEAPAVETPAPEVPAPAAAAPASPFVLLDKPLDLVTKQNPTNVWELSFAHWPDAKAAILLPMGTPFRAVAKYSHPLGGIYFVDQAAYDSHTLHGINTIDLQPAPAPEAKIIQPATEDHIAIKVLPSTPDAWKKSFTASSAGDYIANADTKVYDLADPNAEPQQLVKNQRVHVAGTFTGPVGIKYYRTQKSVESGSYRGIPVIALSAESLASDAEMLLNPTFIQDAREELGKFSAKEKAIRKLASAEVNGLVKRLKIR